MKDLGKYYKQKYLSLRAQYIKTIDFAFREGYAKGQEDAQLQLMQQQVQEAQMQAQQAQQELQMMQSGGGMPGGQGPGMPGEEGAPQEGQIPGQPGMPGETAPPEGQMFDEQAPEDIDGLIEVLQEAINKSEQENPTLQKSLEKLQSIKNGQKSMSWSANLNAPGKLALNEQEKLVSNLVKKWSAESPAVAGEVLSALRSESIKG